MHAYHTTTKVSTTKKGIHLPRERDISKRSLDLGECTEDGENRPWVLHRSLDRRKVNHPRRDVGIVIESLSLNRGTRYRALLSSRVVIRRVVRTNTAGLDELFSVWFRT